MAPSILITPTLHVEVQLAGSTNIDAETLTNTREAVSAWIQSNYATVQIGKVNHNNDNDLSDQVVSVVLADFTGPHEPTGFYPVEETALDIQLYSLHPEDDAGGCRSINHEADDKSTQVRMLALPNITLDEEWDSLVFDDGLPSCLLRYLVRMVGMMGKTGLNVATFNWNKICLLHGPPGSGKSTLCRALAQKLSIRLSNVFPKATLVEVSANAMLSKYFGESGKIIESTFEKVQQIAKVRSKLVVVVIDEVETIAASRQRASNSNECSDGIRATNQLLTALDRLRHLPNILVCCTSNLLEAIDPAFLDRVDIKQHVPPPSSAAVYNIFRSCLNELVRTDLLSSTVQLGTTHTSTENILFPPVTAQVLQKTPPRTRKRKRGNRSPTPPPSQQSVAFVHVPPASEGSEANESVEQRIIPTLPTTLMAHPADPASPGQRVWVLAQRCQQLHLSGRTLRRLPILGLAMYTWGGNIGIDEAISALEKALEEEAIAARYPNCEIKT